MWWWRRQRMEGGRWACGVWGVGAGVGVVEGWVVGWLCALVVVLFLVAVILCWFGQSGGLGAYGDDHGLLFAIFMLTQAQESAEVYDKVSLKSTRFGSEPTFAIFGQVLCRRWPVAIGWRSAIAPQRASWLRACARGAPRV